MNINSNGGSYIPHTNRFISIPKERKSCLDRYIIYHTGMKRKATPTGIVLVCGENSNGELSEAVSLRGLKIVSVCGVGEKSYALTETDAFDVESGEAIGINSPKTISAGVSHLVCVNYDGELYSWGCGEFGELGLGPKYSEVDVPVKVPHAAKFTSVSSGNFHSVALDDRGNMYSWGQNFNRQLGLYRKRQDDLPTAVVVEELVMVPKFVPLSLTCPIKSVACGSSFTVAVSMVSVTIHCNVLYLTD